MKQLLSFSITIILCLKVMQVNAETDQWQLEKDSNGIQIYTRAKEGSSFREIRGAATIKGRMSSIVASLQDMDFWPRLNKLISAASVHNVQGTEGSQVYFEMDMPWPVADRDVLYERRISQDPKTKTVTLVDTALTGVMPKKKGLVRIVESVQRWTLVPNGKDGVDISWTTHTDPNGPIPAAMVNWLSVGPPFESVTVLREAIESGAYADAELPYIQEPCGSR